MQRLTAQLAMAVLLLGGCTIHHSRQALDASSATPSREATFVSEEDSGLGLLIGLFLVSEPDHYAVLLERLRRHYRCAKIHHPQLDFYTDHWLLITFPIARVTAICEPETETEPAAKVATPAAVTENDLTSDTDSPAATPTATSAAPVGTAAQGTAAIPPGVAAQPEPTAAPQPPTAQPDSPSTP